MLNKMIKVALVTVLAISSSTAFARNNQPIRVEASPSRGVQITSPYLRNQHRQYERTKREVINYPSRTINNAFREFDRNLNRRINNIGKRK